MLELQQHRLNELITGLPINTEQPERSTEENDALNYELHVRAGALANEAYSILQNASAAKLLPLAPGASSNHWRTELRTPSSQTSRAVDVKIVRNQWQIKTSIQQARYVRQWELILQNGGTQAISFTDGMLLGDYREPTREMLTLRRMFTMPGRSGLDIRTDFPGTPNYTTLRLIHYAKDPEGNHLNLNTDYIGVQPNTPAYVGWEWDVFCYPDSEPASSNPDMGFHVITVNPRQIAKPELYITNNNDMYALAAQRSNEGLSLTHGMVGHSDIEQLHLSDNISGPIMGVLETELRLLDETFQAHGASKRGSLFTL